VFTGDPALFTGSRFQQLHFFEMPRLGGVGEPVGGRLSSGAEMHPSQKVIAKLLRIGRCMRRHGAKDFPDPGTSIPSNPAATGIGEVTDVDGAILLFPATMNPQAPAYGQALMACGAPLDCPIVRSESLGR
jgi:hypothetical protein